MLKLISVHPLTRGFVASALLHLGPRGVDPGRTGAVKHSNDEWYVPFFSSRAPLLITHVVGGRTKKC